MQSSASSAPVEWATSIVALVLELVDGESLAVRLKASRSSMPPGGG
jgi:hypothetical protein